MVLAEQNFGEMYPQMPAMELIPCEEELARQSNERFETPLYNIPNCKSCTSVSTDDRGSNYITSIFIPTKVEDKFWILRGVTLLCQIKDLK